jgi:hypothetical protein
MSVVLSRIEKRETLGKSTVIRHYGMVLTEDRIRRFLKRPAVKGEKVEDYDENLSQACRYTYQSQLNGDTEKWFSHAFWVQLPNTFARRISSHRESPNPRSIRILLIKKWRVSKSKMSTNVHGIRLDNT